MAKAPIAMLVLLLAGGGAALGTGTGAEAETRAGTGTDLAPPSPAPSEAALAFVSEFSDDHLSAMLSRIGGQSEAMRTLSQIEPAMLAAAFDAEIDAAVLRHGDAWADALARAWSPLLSDAEMRSLAEAGAGSPHVAKYAAAREEAAAAMAEGAQDLFHEILTEVVGHTLERLAAPE